MGLEIESKCLLDTSRVGLTRNGRPVLDRVIDAPVSQDVLTWKDHGSGLIQSILIETLLVKHSPFVTFACNGRRMWITC